MSGLSQAAYFLIETLFDFYITAIILRLLLGYFKADFYNPISQFLVKITNPVLVPLRKFIPSIGKIDTSSIVLAYGLKVIQLLLLTGLAGTSAGLPAILFFALTSLLKLVVWVFIIALIFQAIISWIGNPHGNPVVPLLNTLTDPILKPIQRFVPPIANIDLSPLVAILGLQVLLIFLG